LPLLLRKNTLLLPKDNLRTLYGSLISVERSTRNVGRALRARSVLLPDARPTLGWQTFTQAPYTPGSCLGELRGNVGLEPR
jgi:hypothetical protein